MKKLLSYLIINALSLWVIDQLFATVSISSYTTLAVLTIIFTLCNVFLKPVLKLFALPFTIMTLGLFSFVINAIVLAASFAVVPGAEIDGFAAALIASLVLSCVNWALTQILKTK